MTQPTPYRRGYDFSDAGGAPPPGGPLDDELDDIGLTLREVLRNLALIQRDDTGLRNGIVGIDALDSRVLGLISGGTFSIAGEWATATAYRAGDFFSDAEAVYLVMVAHTSTSIVDDLSSGVIVKVFQNERGVRVRDDFVGNGVQTGFLLSQSVTSQSDVEVYVNGALVPADEYTQVGTALTFDVAPANGADISAFSIMWATTPPFEVFIAAAEAAVADANAAVSAANAAVAAAAAIANDKVDLDGTENVRLITDASNPEAYNIFLTSIADGKQVDGIYGYHEVHSTALSAGYVFHGVTYSATGVGETSAGAVGGACGGPGGGSGLVGNRGDSGPGNGGVFTRLGSGTGWGSFSICQGTGNDSGAGRFLKQNPVAGTSGTGPAVQIENISTNGQALFARSGSANTDSNTVVFERLNGTSGTCTFSRVTGGGARVGMVIGSQTQIVPGIASTGAGAVTAHDVQINANVTGSADARGLNVANAATGGASAIGGFFQADGINTDNYAIFAVAANGGSNYAIYAASGLCYFGGNANAATQYQVGGVKVVGARGAAVADATDAASAITQLNALLARCRAHGLIA